MTDLPSGQPGATSGGGEEFRLRSVAVSAFGPATLFGLAEGAIQPAAVLWTFIPGRPG